ncbi:MAG: nucleoside recognition protein [Gammaproteobacteria bacterium]|nr:nucleoside recognition protein [Gammaproteobacteria bacterium]
MMNIIWLGLILASVILGAINGTIPDVVASVTTSAQFAFELVLGLIGIMALWLGLMRIAEEAGLIRGLARLLRPIMTRLFPDVPSDHPAMGAMLLNIAANMLGLGNAATPFGLRAMEQLEKLNPVAGTATNAMCMFLAINTSSVQLIPATAIAYLAANGDPNPTNIIVPTLIATACSTTAAIIAAKYLQRWKIFRVIPTHKEQV